VSEKLHAREKGSGGEPIVLLHGFGGHHGDWTDIQPDLARDRLVLAYDLPGHGRSRDVAGAGSAGASAKAILADLEARHIPRFHLAGFSMGGAIAVLTALRAPQAVASLTLLAPGGFGPEINAPLLRRFAEATSADGLRVCLDEMSAPGFSTLTRDVAGLAAVRFVPGMRDRMLEVVAAITKGGTQGEIPRDMMAGLKIPVSVVWGTADPVLPYTQSAELPGSWALQTLPGVGHMMLTESRKAVTAAIRRTAS
jgi:pyruvate dehydrogenase E2 component (dihydrolipoamide acetyltransferase)